MYLVILAGRDNSDVFTCGRYRRHLHRHCAASFVWRATVDKVLTTHHDLLEGFFAGVSNVMKAARIGPRDVDGVVVHATTIVTNVLIERKGKSTALLVTEGFRDVLHIRNEHRYEMYDPQIEFADPLVPAELTFGVAERVRADGTILREPDAKAGRGARRHSQGKGRGVRRDLLSQQLSPIRTTSAPSVSSSRRCCRKSSSRCLRRSRHRSANIRAPRPPP